MSNYTDPEKIAEMADNDEDVTQFFKNPKLKGAKIRVNVDFTPSLLSELDTIVEKLGTGRQAVIKMAVMNMIDAHKLANKSA